MSKINCAKCSKVFKSEEILFPMMEIKCPNCNAKLTISEIRKPTRRWKI